MLFERITDLVVETFTFDKTDPVVWEDFKKKGIFPFSTFKRISGRSDDLLTPELLVKLLEHLHIIAPLQEDTEEEDTSCHVYWHMPSQHKLPKEFVSRVKTILSLFGFLQMWLLS